MFSYKGIVIPLAGDAGLEPANAGVKVPCLTTWLVPNKMAAKPLGVNTLAFDFAALGTTIT